MESTKLCECGCGQPAPISKVTSKKKGIKKGDSLRFIHGHHRRIPFTKYTGGIKLCECGCGLPTQIAKRTRSSRGWIEGYPKKYIYNHNKGNPFASISDRFWKHVDIKTSDECWNWIGAKHFGGYGMFVFRRKMMSSHRVAFEISGGKFSKDKTWVLHRCDNPSCCNPAHLFAGNRQDNIDDMVNKKRNYSAKGEKHNGAKLSNKDIYEIRELKGIMTQLEIAKLYGVSNTLISMIQKRLVWKHLP